MKHFFSGITALAMSLAAFAQPNCEQIIQASFTSTVQGNILVLANTSQSMFPQATTYTWFYGDGGSGPVSDVTHLYTEPGTYLVCLYAVVENCVDTVCQEVTIGGGDPCDALANTTISLSTLEGGVSFSYSELPAYANTFWYFGDGAMSDAAQGFHPYQEPGTYTVCLWAWFIVEGTNDTCSREICQPITVAGGQDPCAGLAAGFTPGIQGNTVQFSNTTSGTGFQTTWHWEFGDGTTGDGAQPSHTYPQPGTYLACLTALSVYEQQGGGLITCADTICHEVHIQGGGSPCDSLTADFVVTTQENLAAFSSWGGTAVGYHWTFGDGTTGDGPSPTHTYAEPGTYHACLVTWAWDPLTQDTCYADHCEWVTIGGTEPCDSLQAGFFANVGDATVWFSNTTIGTGFQTTWHWSFGDGTTSEDAQPSHIFPGLSTYEVCLTATTLFEQQGGGVITCQDQYCAAVVTGGGSPCDSLSADFVVTTQENLAAFSSFGGTAIGYHWTFGDGTAGDGPSPIHTYPGPGTYHACLVTWAWNPFTQDTCYADHCEWVTIAGEPGPCDSLSAEFWYGANGGDPLSIFFSASDPGGTGTHWLWSFGDGTYSDDGPQGTHTYDGPGSYEFCLTAWQWIPGTQDTCSVTTCQPVVIGGGGPCDSLEACFVPSQVGALQVFFNNCSVGPDQNLEYLWHFGDGTTSDDLAPTHTYPEPGSYVVCLTVYWGDDCVDEYCQTLFVQGGNTPCDSLFTATFQWFDQFGTVSFYAVSTPPASGYIWYFGDGTMGDGANTQHLYAEPGEYHVCLAAWHWNQNTLDTCWAEHCEWIVISGEGGPCDSLEALFVWEPVGQGVFQFQDASFTNGQGVSYFWSFGDGSFSDGADPAHTFPEPGQFQVCLTITALNSPDSCSSTTCHIITVQSGGPPCDQLNAEFSATVSGFIAALAAGFNPPGTSFEWHFGDGTFGDGANTTHTYPGPGTYNVCLIVGNYDPVTQDSCFEDHCLHITLEQGGTACDSLWNASFEFSHQDNVFTFHNTSDTQGAEVSTHWSFGDGTFGDDPQLVHTYTTSGVYVVCMTITGLIPGTNDSCQVETCHTLEVSVGIEDPASGSAINIWPQPFDGGLHVTGSELQGNTRCMLLDMTGRLVDDRTALSQGGVSLDYAHLPPGSYVLRLRNAQMDRSVRVMKR